ncbi:MAG: hypothetical protein O7J95_16280 [Planctomycetota bacterium]|nr:hypothetical protein [Planctomycetota bacterium]
MKSWKQVALFAGIPVLVGFVAVFLGFFAGLTGDDPNREISRHVAETFTRIGVILVLAGLAAGAVGYSKLLGGENGGDASDAG